MNKQDKYVVMVDDNFHFMDTSERYKDGEYETYDEAVAKCKEIVDSFLVADDTHKLTAEQLLNSYQMFGEDPFIIGNKEYDFSAWDYAKKQSKIICAK